ncbi:MAG: DUF3090 domain-containing protein [Ornithinimicrobium sp.]
MPLIDFDPPERFIAEAVGPPGGRTFFLQAIAGSRVMTVSVEKEQVRLLGESLSELLDEMAPAPEGPEGQGSAHLKPDTGPLHTPIEEDFRARALTLAWDPDRRTATVEANEHDPDTAADSDAGDSDSGADPLSSGAIRVVLDVPMARGFAQRCAAAVEGGRPSCPFCGGPLDPSGHICPRANGYKR